jgi:hypothetical protein
MKTTKKSLKGFFGTDADLETSLFEYQFICTPYKADGREDEYFCIYQQGPDQYGTGFITEESLNNLMKGEDWLNEEDIKSMLNSVDLSLNDWLERPFVHKLRDLLGYYGSENIFGTDYTPYTEKQIRKIYKF